MQTSKQNEEKNKYKGYKNDWHRALVAHACNPSYSGGRDQEDHGSKPAQVNRPYLEKTLHKKGLVEWFKV
jgi:hypothetical protein